MKLIYSPRSLRDLRRIGAYIRKRSPRGAERVAKRIDERIRGLVEFPHSGAPHVMPGLRTLTIAQTSYLAIYRIRDDAVEIVTILHTSREHRT